LGVFTHKVSSFLQGGESAYVPAATAEITLDLCVLTHRISTADQI
jgi:hypothetical protein